jgi:hypothetical protein
MVARAAARERESPIVMYHQGQYACSLGRSLGLTRRSDRTMSLLLALLLVYLQSSVTGTPALIRRRTRRGTAIT